MGHANAPKAINLVDAQFDFKPTKRQILSTVWPYWIASLGPSPGLSDHVIPVSVKSFDPDLALYQDPPSTREAAQRGLPKSEHAVIAWCAYLTQQ